MPGNGVTRTTACLERITEPEGGAWCEVCLLPSAVTFDVALLHTGPIKGTDRAGRVLMECLLPPAPDCLHIVAVTQCQEAHQPQEA